MIQATALHGNLLAAIHIVAFPPHATWDAEAFSGQLALPGVYGFVTETGCVLARVAADEAEILTLAVVPVARRAGLGRLLLHAAETEAERRGGQKMFLEVAADNVAARHLYAASGYVQVGVRRRYYGETDALVLSRALSGRAA